MAEKKQSKFKKISIVFLIFLVIGYIAGACILYFTNDNNYTFLDALYRDGYAFVGLGAGFLFGLIYIYMATRKKSSGMVSGKTTGKTAEGVEMDLNFNAKMLTPDEFGKQNGVISTTWAQLPNLKKTGLVIQNSLRNGKYNITMNELLFIGNLGTGEIIIIAIIVLLLFGGKKIPELMKGIGKGVKNFKDGVKGLEDDIKVDDTENEKK